MTINLFYPFFGIHLAICSMTDSDPNLYNLEFTFLTFSCRLLHADYDVKFVLKNQENS